MAWVLAEMDMNPRLPGLPEEIEIGCRNKLFLQRLDYWKMSFHCLKCRLEGHLKKDCWNIEDIYFNAPSHRSKNDTKDTLKYIERIPLENSVTPIKVSSDTIDFICHLTKMVLLLLHKACCGSKCGKTQL